MHLHFAVYKPYGYLSQFVCNARKKKMLGELFDFPEGTMAIGRLDEDSEGLLLLTTDGKLSLQIRSKNIEKEYYVQVNGLITDEAIEILRAGIEISIEGKKYKTLACDVARLVDEPLLPPRGRNIRGAQHGPTSWIAITITEGKFRQVRKMTAAAGFPTLRLVRVRVGEIRLGDMQPGDVRVIVLGVV